MDSAKGAKSLAGGSNIIGGLTGGFDTYMGMKEGDENRRHQIKLAKNRYQWMMKDLKFAGLNPILAGNLGGTLSGGTSGISSNVGGSTAAMNSSAAANRQAAKQEALLDSEIDINEATAKKIKKETEQLGNIETITSTLADFLEGIKASDKSGNAGQTIDKIYSEIKSNPSKYNLRDQIWNYVEKASGSAKPSDANTEKPSLYDYAKELYYKYVK